MIFGKTTLKNAEYEPILKTIFQNRLIFGIRKYFKIGNKPTHQIHHFLSNN